MADFGDDPVPDLSLARSRDSAERNWRASMFLSHGGNPLGCLTDYLTFETTVFFIVANYFAVECHNPPSLAFPFRRNEGGVECPLVAEIEWSGRSVNYTRRSRFDLAAAVRRLTIRV